MMNDHHQINVLLRVRPLRRGEKGGAGVVHPDDDGVLSCAHGGKRRVRVSKAPVALDDEDENHDRNDPAATMTTMMMTESIVFEFDRCLFENDAMDPAFAQEETFLAMEGPRLVREAKTRNSVIMAYGQTGSGKTYTIFGDMGNETTFGILPRFLKELFQHRSTSWEDANNAIAVSAFEIFNDQVIDILSQASSSRGGTQEKSSGGTRLKVRLHPVKGPFVENLAREEIDSFRSASEVIHRLVARRKTQATMMNDTSSRSHAVVSIHFSSGTRTTFVDLAGSERADKSGARGARLQEAASINRSLSALGGVINALAHESERLHRPARATPAVIPPWRNSLLTWLLKGLLIRPAPHRNGEIQASPTVILLATVCPDATCYEETLSTMRFAGKARGVVTSVLPTAPSISSTSVNREVAFDHHCFDYDYNDSHMGEADDSLDFEDCYDEEPSRGDDDATTRNDDVVEELRAQIELLENERRVANSLIADLRWRLALESLKVRGLQRQAREKIAVSSSSDAPPALPAHQLPNKTHSIQRTKQDVYNRLGGDEKEEGTDGAGTTTDVAVNVLLTPPPAYSRRPARVAMSVARDVWKETHDATQLKAMMRRVRPIPPEEGERLRELEDTLGLWEEVLTGNDAEICALLAVELEAHALRFYDIAPALLCTRVEAFIELALGTLERDAWGSRAVANELALALRFLSEGISILVIEKPLFDLIRHRALCAVLNVCLRPEISLASCPALRLRSAQAVARLTCEYKPEDLAESNEKTEKIDIIRDVSVLASRVVRARGGDPASNDALACEYAAEALLWAVRLELRGRLTSSMGPPWVPSALKLVTEAAGAFPFNARLRLAAQRASEF